MPLFHRHLGTADLGATLVAPASRSAAAHLASCERCRRERSRLATRLDLLRTAAEAEADAALPATMLDRQRSAIARRIARLGSAGRVLPFPMSASPTHTVHAAGPDARWIMAAAAAGLLLGLLVGRVPLGTPAATTRVAVERSIPARGSAPASTAEAGHDDGLLSDVEELLTRETRPEFGALDLLTPVSDEVR
ncbi:MAG: hypothetical protein AB7O28_21010 [Vicinamibacterales bacterium]